MLQIRRDEQDVPDTLGEIKINSYATFNVGLLQIDAAVLAIDYGLTYSLDDLSEVIYDRDTERERERERERELGKSVV